jgi:Domain of unknown function (DUF4062)
LVDERREVIEAIIDLGHIPAGMEGFPAIDIEQFKYIQKVIDQCDYYVLIVAGRYGSSWSHGLIQEIRGDSTAAPFGEWIQITDTGTRLMTEEMVIRADNPTK